MQAVHCAFAVGGVVAPFITQPFLAPRNVTSDYSLNHSALHHPHALHDPHGLHDPHALHHSILNFDLADGDDLQLEFDFQRHLDVNDNVTSHAIPRHTQIHFAYLISSSVCFLASIPLIAEYVRDYVTRRRRAREAQNGSTVISTGYATIECSVGGKETKPTKGGARNEGKRAGGGETDRAERRTRKSPEGEKTRTEPVRTCRLDLPGVPRGVVVVWMCLFYLVFVGVEMTVPYYLASYAVLEMGWSKARGALFTSVFWLSFAGTRLLCVFLVRVLRALQLLLLCLTLMVPALLGLLLASLWQQDWGVWLSNAVGGAAMSAVFASALSWMNAELVHVTGRVTSYVIFASNVGPMVNPMILGHLIEHKGPIWIAYVLLGEAVLSLFIFLGLLLFTRLYLQPRYGASGRIGNDVIVSFTSDGRLPQSLTSSIGGNETTRM